MPMPIPAIAVGTRCWNLPTTAAASAGTTKSVYVLGTTGESGAIRMPAAPTTAPASIQFNSAIRSGEMPLTYAPASFSAVARVSRPNLVQR